MDGNKIYYYRKKRGLTQKEASKGICSVSYLSKIENNSIVASSEIINLLYDRLEMTRSSYDETQIVHIKQEIHEWHRALIFHQEDRIMSGYQKITELMQDMDHPKLLLLYYTVCIRFHLYYEEQTKAKELLDQLDLLNQDRKIEDNELQYFIVFNNALYAEMICDFESAHEFYEKAYSLGSDIGKKDSDFLYHLAFFCMKIGMFHHGILFAKEAIADFDAIANYKRSLECHILLGRLNRYIKEYTTAKEHFKTALNATRTNPVFSEFMAPILYHFGKSLYDEELYEEAIKLFLESYDVTSINHAQVCCALSRAYFKTDDIEKAHSWLNNGFNAMETKEQSVDLIELMLHKFAMNKTEHTSAYQAYVEDTALPYLEKTQNRLFLLHLYESLANYYTAKHAHKSANNYYIKLNKLYKKYV
ncbi:transcriptional regulator [Fictibacillus macauensis ZFHKF-1]|uniref:Transcriptional regulator n=1 Tax=Fictibacillus macauensis ZFHKF-1 TaxID=1196324 RepID=I8UI56_9BACL|nr:helix-turn-helix domain-containing protein [Fictibacillus macauensis]EIT86498.1 transcriptional regulator [Fictibacillus macauensis ZFHKF-1]